MRCREVVMLEALLNEKIDGIEKRTEQARGDLERSVVKTAEALEKSHNAAVVASEKHTEIIAGGLERRLELLNEFRTAMKDQSADFYTRIEHATYAEAVSSDLRSLRESRAELKGMASQTSVNVAFAMALIGAVTGLVSLVHMVLGK
jgi:hypothetical protein